MRLVHEEGQALHLAFQSTHSLRSATRLMTVLSPICPFQSTHSLRSATNCTVLWRGLSKVSIHALLAECDPPAHSRRFPRGCFNPRTPCGVRLPATAPPAAARLFQSTHSLRSATGDAAHIDGIPLVSIHALLAECDLGLPIFWLLPSCFNPRTPCGVRR